jgi:catechol 2,3-dioxygenase-like lactoylglutathione lyase family enzyme
LDQSVHFITIATADLDAARAFYVDGLGWTPHLDVPGEIIFFQIAPGLMLGYFEAGKFAADTGLSPTALGIGGLTLAHNLDSPEAVDATVSRLASCGGTVTKQPQPSEFGGTYHAHVRDPNGLLWEIAYNPSWRIEADGSVVL